MKIPLRHSSKSKRCHWHGSRVKCPLRHNSNIKLPLTQLKKWKFHYDTVQRRKCHWHESKEKTQLDHSSNMKIPLVQFKREQFSELKFKRENTTTTHFKRCGCSTTTETNSTVMKLPPKTSPPVVKLSLKPQSNWSCTLTYCNSENSLQESTAKLSPISSGTLEWVSPRIVSRKLQLIY